MECLCRRSMSRTSVGGSLARRQDQVFSIEPNLDAGSAGSVQGAEGAHIFISKQAVEASPSAGFFLISFRRRPGDGIGGIGVIGVAPLCSGGDCVPPSVLCPLWSLCPTGSPADINAYVAVPHFPASCLARQDEPGSPRTDQCPKFGLDELPPASLRVEDLAHVLVQIADGNGAVAMTITPGLEQLADELPLRIPRLGAAHLLDDILAAECQQRVTNPPGPTLEAAQGLARLAA